MTLQEMRELPPTELRAEVQKAREKLWKMRFQARGEPIESPGALRELKRDVARMLTVLRQGEQAEQAQQAAAGPAAGSSASSGDQGESS